MDIQLLPWSEAAEIALLVRIEVFVKEQSVPEDLELDEYDPIATHAVLFEDNLVIGTGRVFQKDVTTRVFYIGRLCVLKKYRGAGYGEYLFKTLIEYAKQQGAIECQIHAQIVSQLFYKKFGFVADAEVFMEAGIEHMLMRLAMTK